MCTQVVSLIKRGIRNPRQIPGYLLGRFFPDSRWSSNWRVEDGIVKWNGLGWGVGDPPEISAVDYYTYKTLEATLGGWTLENALDLGCGFGRMTPWLDEFAEEAYGTDPDETVVEIAKSHYPHIEFRTAAAQDLPFPDATFDLVAARGVLAHIPPEHVESATDEIQRVLTNRGRLLAFEVPYDPTARGPMAWGRSAERYETLLSEMSLVETGSFDVPGIDEEDAGVHHRDLLLFRME